MIFNLRLCVCNLKFQFVDVNLATLLFQKFGDLKNLGPSMVRKLNDYILFLDIMEIWNGCNGLHLDLLSELSM